MEILIKSRVRSKIVMRCGHVANHKDFKGNPICSLCYGYDHNAKIINEHVNLQGRQAKCSFCGKIKNSSLQLPFFQYTPFLSTDLYYCGCCRKLEDQ